MGSIFYFLCALPPIASSLSPSLSLFLSLSLCHRTTPPTPPNPFLPGWLCYLSTAWCIQFTRLFSVISVNWILSITYRCFHICIKVRVVKSVKLQFRQCHSNKYTGLFLSSSSSSGSLEVGIHGFCLNLNRFVFLGRAGSHIHVNMNMKMTGWLCDTGCVTMRGWVCVNLFNNLPAGTCLNLHACLRPHGHSHGRFVTQTAYVGIAVLYRGSQ